MEGIGPPVEVQEIVMLPPSGTVTVSSCPLLRVVFEKSASNQTRKFKSVYKLPCHPLSMKPCLMIVVLRKNTLDNTQFDSVHTATFLLKDYKNVQVRGDKTEKLKRMQNGQKPNHSMNRLFK